MKKGLSKLNAPMANWLADFTNKVAKEPELLSNSATSRKDITNRISEIVSGVSASSPYGSVSEAVADYQQRIGLFEYRKKALAQQMIDEVADADDYTSDEEYEEDENEPYDWEEFSDWDEEHLVENLDKLNIEEPVDEFGLSESNSAHLF